MWEWCFPIRKTTSYHRSSFYQKWWQSSCSSQSLGFSWSNGCPNPSVANNQNHEERLQWTSQHASSHDRESICQDGKDVTDCKTSWYGLSRDSWLYICDSLVKKNFLISWEEERSTENPITIEEDERFSEPWTPVSEPPAMEAPPTEARPDFALFRAYKVLRTQVLDSSWSVNIMVAVLYLVTSNFWHRFFFFLRH